MKRVVVTGIGVITPIGKNIAEYWSSLISGVSGAAPITLFDATHFKTRFACEVKDFAPELYIDKREVRRYDRFAQFAMAAAAEAMADANFDLNKLDLDRAGVIVGSGIGGLRSLEAEIEEFTLKPPTPRYNTFMIPKMIPDIAAGMLSIKYGFRGINYATVSACATSAHAIINAFDYIRIGKANIIIAGGSEASIAKPGVGGFTALKAMSERNDDPTTASRPFDKDRDGFVLGEGGAILILEEYQHAKKRGAKIYAEMVGSGMTADAYHMTAPHPEGIGAASAMQLALKEAKLSPETIGYINVHGTSTPLGDVAELNAIKKVFGETAYNLNISSTKSMTGHLLGAAGSVEAVASILAMQHNLVPPTINHFTDDPAIDPRFNLTFNQPQERDLKAVMSNAFGFGGHNTTVVFKKI
jgi:3-oxoacyl-[acyl-carrier-protein] synthase II